MVVEVIRANNAQEEKQAIWDDFCNLLGTVIPKIHPKILEELEHRDEYTFHEWYMHMNEIKKELRK